MSGVAKVYVVPASHPCAVVMRAMESKGIPYQRIDLVPAVHKLVMLALFRGATVPAVTFDDGTKVLGTRAILRELDRRVPEPRVVSDDPAALAAETFGDEVLQPLVRRVLWAALQRKPGAVASFSEGARLPVPAPLARLSAPLVVFVERKLNASSDAAVRDDLAAMSGHLDRVGAWLADGTLGGEHPHAGDLQVASSLRLLLTLGDLAPIIDATPAGPYARKLFPRYPGHVPSGALPV